MLHWRREAIRDGADRPANELYGVESALLSANRPESFDALVQNYRSELPIRTSAQECRCYGDDGNGGMALGEYLCRVMGSLRFDRTG
jgi:hypothetical protein